MAAPVGVLSSTWTALCSPRARTQLRAVLLKNARLMMRNKRDAVREFGMPLLLLCALVLLSNTVPNVTQASVTDYPTYAVPTLQAALAAAGPAAELWFAPCNGTTPEASLCQSVRARVGVSVGVRTRGFACEIPAQCGDDSLLRAYGLNSQAMMAAVVIDNASLPVAYRIRLDVDTYAAGAGRANTTAAYGPDGAPLPPSNTPAAYIGTVMPVQSAVDAAISASVLGAPLPTSLSFFTRQFPSAAYEVNVMGAVLVGIIPIYMTIIFTLQVRVLLTRILEEKERKIKIALKMMGLTDEMFWASWTITALIKNTLLVTVVVVIAVAAKIFPRSSMGVVWVFFFLFELTCIAFCFAVTSMFSKSRTGGAVGMLVYLALAAPSYALTSPLVPQGAKLFLSLLAPCAFNLGVSVITMAEQNNVGVQWSNVANANLTSAGVSLSQLMGMLVLDTVLYLGLAWYLDKVVPTEFGTTRHPLFCLGFRRTGGSQDAVERARRNVSCRARLAGCIRGSGPEEQRALMGGEALPAAAPVSLGLATDAPPVDGSGAVAAAAASSLLSGDADVELVAGEVARRPGIHIKQLSKVFPAVGADGPRVAVDQLSMSLYEGHVTCLLGHNGAGKTTTVGLLTGMFPPTAGDADVYGLSLLNDMAAVRDMIGVCPQHDILFDQMTVAEHLFLYGGIKGLDAVTLAHRVPEMIREVGLEEKADTWAGRLSGGQKRRLSVAMAMIGMPKIVILDEPTSGLDPSARRQVWNMIQKYKAGRVIILTTHFMDEADILGDRIALMARGRLRVCGSSLYLKNRFGVGYHLTATVAAGSSSQASEITAQHADVAPISSLIASHVPQSRFAGAIPTLVTGVDGGARAAYEVAFVLPYDSLHLFPGLFDALDAAKVGDSAVVAVPSSGLLGYSISITTLEEVFLRLSQLIEEEEARERERATRGASQQSGPSSSIDNSDDSDPKPSPWPPTTLAGATVPRDTTASLSPWWWLDSRRRALVHDVANPSQSEADFVDRVRASLPTPKRTWRRDAWSFMWRQIMVQLWRRFQQIKRDPRNIWLQCVTPVIFVAVGTIFRLLKAVDTTQPASRVPFVPATFQPALPPTIANFSFPILNTVPGDAWLDSMTTAVLAHFPSRPATPAAPFAYQLDLSNTSVAAIDAAVASSSYLAGVAALAGTASVASVTLMWNSTLSAVLPTMLSFVDSSMLHLAMNATTGTSGNPTLFETTLDPMPATASTSAPALGTFLSSALMGFYIALGYVTIPAIQAANVVMERESKAKQLQLIMGATPLGYWSATWLWDAIQYSVPFLGGIIIVAAAGPSELHGINFLAAALLLLFFGLAIPGPTYVLSFLFEKHADAQMWIRLSFSGLTILTFFASFALEFPALQASTPGLAAVASGLQYIFMAFPPYALAKGFTDVAVKASCNPILQAAGLTCAIPSPFSWDIAGAKLCYLIVSIPVWMLALVAAEYFSVARGGRGAASGVPHPADTNAVKTVQEDDDVVAERVHVDTLGAGDRHDADSGIVARHLRKVYTAGAVPKVAVADLSLHIRDGECFGLLGPNGAGKTTTLSMLVTELAPTSGAATIYGMDVTTARRQALDLVGFCPQFDALFDLLTGEEVLTYYAAINGTAAEHLPALVTAALRALDLTRYAKTFTKNYSGGNKRRLSLALAYIGAPLVVYLDEPSTGVDPMARKRMFHVITNARAGRVTVMTTHVMEEADGLCSRIGIMVDGRLACLGSSQHLKTKYGRGYIIEVRLEEHGAGGSAVPHASAAGGTAATALSERVDEVTSVVQSVASGVRLCESSAGHLRYEVAAVGLGAAFRALEGARQRLNIRDYSVSLTTLEAVFLGFSKVQEQVDEQAQQQRAAWEALQRLQA